MDDIEEHQLDEIPEDELELERRKFKEYVARSEVSMDALAARIKTLEVEKRQRELKDNDMTLIENLQFTLAELESLKQKHETTLDELEILREALRQTEKENVSLKISLEEERERVKRLTKEFLESSPDKVLDAWSSTL